MVEGVGARAPSVTGREFVAIHVAAPGEDVRSCLALLLLYLSRA